MAALAEHEARRIGERMKDALRAAKARGTLLVTARVANLQPNIEARQTAADSFAEKLGGQVAGFRLRNLSQRQMAAELNDVGIKTARGRNWSLIQLQRLIRRLKPTVC